MSNPEREDLPWLRKLFEKGVAGFYETTLSNQGYKVTAGKRINWPVSDSSPEIDRILPSMKTDIMIDNIDLEQRIVIDTKFNAVLTSGWYRNETLRSGYIYQMYAYLRSQEDSTDSLDKYATGLFIHPSVGEDINEYVVIQNHKIQFATVNLAASAKELRRQLLGLIK